MFDFRGLIEGLLIMGGLVAGLVFNIILVVLKLFGVLLLSWWHIIMFMPAMIVVVLLIAIFVAGIQSLFK